MRDQSLPGHDEAVRIFLIAAQRPAESEQFRRHGGEPSCCYIFAIVGNGGFVSSILIAPQSIIQRALPSQAFVNRSGQEVCVTKGIANS